MFYVTTVNKGVKFWLRGTTWAFREERADRFETDKQAEEAIARAAKFMTPTVRKACRVTRA